MTLGCHNKLTKNPISRRTWPTIRSVKHPVSRAAAWQVDAGRINGQRVRRNFRSKKEAKAYAKKLREERARGGLAAFELTIHQREQARQAFEILKTHHTISLVEAVSFYVRHKSPAAEEVTLSQLIERLLLTKERENKRPQYLKDLSFRCRSFLAHAGDKRISEITRFQIEEWLFARADVSNQTVHNNYRNVRVLFNFALQANLLTTDPLSGVKPPTVDQCIEILRIEQCQQLLITSSKLDERLQLLPYVALGLFCGIRTAELAGLLWENINIGEKLVTIPSTIAKKRRIRLIEISDNCVQWLNSANSKKNGAISPPNRESRFTELVKAAGISPWPNNAMRHSFASYFYAMTEDAAKTCARLGQRNDAVLFDHYRALTTKKEAIRYFEIAPSRIIADTTDR